MMLWLLLLLLLLLLLFMFAVLSGSAAVDSFNNIWRGCVRGTTFVRSLRLRPNIFF
jgi:hypothetical protein